MYKSYDQLGVDPEKNKDSFNVLEILNSDHKNEIIMNNRFVCIEYYADWCGPCKQTSSTYGIIASNYHQQGNCAVVKYNVDKIGPQETDRKLIKGIPSFLFYVNGQIVDQITGADMEKVENTIKKYSQTQNNSFGLYNNPSSTVGPGYNRNSIRHSKTSIPDMTATLGNPYKPDSGNYYSF